MKGSWPSTILFVAALIFASCQCVLACVDQPIPRQVPPCHKQSDAPDQHQPQHCANSPVLILEDHTLQSAFHDALPVAGEPLFVLPAAQQYVPAIQTTPPRSPDFIRSSVLRV